METCIKLYPPPPPPKKKQKKTKKKPKEIPNICMPPYLKFSDTLPKPHFFGLIYVSTETSAYTQRLHLLEERVIVYRHRCHMAAKIDMFAGEEHNTLPTLYRLPKLHKTPFKSRFIDNSSSRTTTELSLLLTSCLTAISIPCY